MNSTRRVRLAAVAVAAFVTVGLVGGVAVAAPAAEPRGKSAWWYKALKIADAHKTATGKGVTIALIDGPVDPEVPELVGQKVKPIANLCGGDPTAVGSLASHGTSMAVAIVGSGRKTAGGSIGTFGVAPDATVRTYAADLFPAPGLQCSPGVDGTAVAIRRAVEDGAKILSISVGGAEEGAPMAEAVKFALDRGVIVVAAAGDARDPSVIYPAATPGVVAVVAVDRNAKAWAKNPKGNRKAFAIAAPGVDIPTSAYDGPQWVAGIASGTSEATALVAGGLALAMEKWPKATENQHLQNLIRTPAARTAFARDLTTGYGVMSIVGMLRTDPTQWNDVNPLLPAGPDASAATTATPNKATSEPTTPAAQPVASDPVAQAADSDDGGGGAPVWIFVVVGLVVVGAVGGGLVMARGRGAKGVA